MKPYAFESYSALSCLRAETNFRVFRCIRFNEDVHAELYALMSACVHMSISLACGASAVRNMRARTVRHTCTYTSTAICALAPCDTHVRIRACTYTYIYARAHAQALARVHSLMYVVY